MLQWNPVKLLPFVYTIQRLDKNTHSRFFFPSLRCGSKSIVFAVINSIRIIRENDETEFHRINETGAGD